MDSSNCQTLTASPAEPGGLLSRTSLSHLQVRSRIPTTEEVKQMKKVIPLIAISLLLAGSVMAGDPNKDIVDTAITVGQFNTLAKALQVAGLIDTLKGKGPFTVFAPTDEAFAKLPGGTVEELMKPENKAKLVAILTYHVVPGEIKASDVVKLTSAKTVNGEPLKVTSMGGNVMINDANVVKADILCSNGVIHVIDTVLLPDAK